MQRSGKDIDVRSVGDANVINPGVVRKDGGFRTEHNLGPEVVAVGFETYGENSKKPK